MKNNNRNNKLPILIISLIIILAIVGALIFNIINNNEEQKIEENNTEQMQNITEEDNVPEVIEGKVDIIGVNSKTRPYALIVNNTPVAVKVQEGLNDAYLVYEVATEGNTSRLIALYKDVEESLVVGTIRSARHNFVDFALESDAILCCFGWSHHAEDDMKAAEKDIQDITDKSVAEIDKLTKKKEDEILEV